MSFPSSIWSAILSVRQDPERVKDLVVRRYREPIYEFVRRQGLPHEDAEDVTQEVFLRVCREDFLERADRQKGKFRTLLLAVTRHVIGQYRRYELSERRDRRRQISLGDFDAPVDPPSNEEFDRLWVRNLVAQAMDRLKDDPMIRALRLQMEGRSYQEIGAALGKSVTDVTNYIHRAKERLRRQIEEIISEYSGREQAPAEIADLMRLV
ncbi:MAG TPA: sigma-70 family RNA polymerase sigma factor [Planctomycetota bacterium]|nr:sigma-70 family RNA polymerase sigma factor [Planctomycetota bacterium]